MALRLMDGSQAIAEAAIAAGLKFYAGYPMSPATDLLEQMASRLPSAGGVCINAETEIGGVNMALGASVTGFRAASGSCGQGLALMQEAIAEAALNETPLVIFNMARNQQDYFQATRGGGWGDYRTITLAPKDVPEAVELARETRQTLDAYGVGKSPTDEFGRNCLIARRLVERGVRFIQLYSGGGHLEETWDAHASVEKNHGQHGAEVDQPIAALLGDLEQRGMLDETLVVWGGEFGRMPFSEGKGAPGRNHNPYGFSMWLAGGGVKGGMAHGATDEFGFEAVEDKVHLHDLHATILHLMGLDHERLTYFHQGRDERLTDVYGQGVRQVLA